MRFVVFISIFVLFAAAASWPLSAHAQQKDSLKLIDGMKVKARADTTSGPKPHSPKKAVWLSAVVPGAGQVYNKKAWKVPIIYAGIGTGVYSILWNRSVYLDFKSAYIKRVDVYAGTVDEKYAGIYSDDNLLELQETYRRYMELSYIGVTAFYVLQLVDATVDAHLFDFDVSPDLSLHVRPSLLYTPGSAGPYSGFTLKLKL